MSVTLLLLFGAVNLALYGYLQAMADGSSYVGARSIAQSSLTQSAAQSKALSIIAMVFPHVAPSAVAVSLGSNANTTSVTLSGPPLTFVGHGTVWLRAHATEKALNGTVQVPGGVSFAASTLLRNVPGNSNYPIWVAQTLTSNALGGLNGRFGDWFCHSRYFQAIMFPTSAGVFSSARQAARALLSTTFSTTLPGSVEYPLYQVWDITHVCA